MKKIIIILILLHNFLTAQINSYTLKDFVLYVSDKTNKTIILPEHYNMIELSYYEVSNIDYIESLRQILKDNELELIKINNSNYVISKIPELLPQDEQTQNKKYSEIVNTRLDVATIESICKTLNYQCSYISNSNYIVSSDIEINLQAFNSDFNNNPLFLVGTIYEINLTNAKQNNININALLQNTTTLLNFDFLGNLQALYNSTYQNESKRSFETVLKFLVETGNASILSKPSLTLTDNKLVSFHNGEKIAVQQTSITNNETGMTQKQFTTIDTGINISFLPQFLPNGSVDVDLNLEIKSILDYDKDKNLANLTSKTLKGRYNFFKNRPLQLVSFNTLSKNDNVSKVPFFSSIPLIGNLFQNTNKSNNEKLIIIFFTLQDKPENLDIQSNIILDDKNKNKKNHENIKGIFGL